MGCALSMQVRALRDEVADLRAENAELRAQLEHRGQPAAVVAPGKAPEAKASPGRTPPLGTSVIKHGDHVISHYIKHSFFTATVVEFDKARREFVVKWDDGGDVHTRQPHDKVCLDKTPAADEVGVGTIVMFPQGLYAYTRPADGVRLTGQQRFHEGRVTAIEKDEATGMTWYVGEHVHGKHDGMWTSWKGYEPTFRCELAQLRIFSNLLALMAADASGGIDGRQPNGASGRHMPGRAVPAVHCDVYLSHALADVESAKSAGGVGAVDPLSLVRQIEARGWKVAYDRTGGADLEATLAAMSTAHVVVACVSDAYAAQPNTRQELQFAKKTLRKPVLPVVVGRADESWAFMSTLVGLLIAGDLYVDLRSHSGHAGRGGKEAELLGTLATILSKEGGTADGFAATPVGSGGSDHGASAARDSGARAGGAASSAHATIRSAPTVLAPARCDVFVSYCWANSALALGSGQTTTLHGHELADPRALSAALIASGLTTWLDVDALGGGSGLFEEIAAGVQAARVVLVCASAEYAASDNCRMELQYALKVLRKPCVLAVVGSDSSWEPTVVGLLTSALRRIDLYEDVAVDGQAGLDRCLATLQLYLRKELDFASAQAARAQPALPGANQAEVTPGIAATRKAGGPPPAAGVRASAAEVLLRERESGVIKPGDHVISHYIKHSFFTATVVEFDKASREFVVKWDDGGDVHTRQPFERVCLDVPPAADEVGVGTIVMFPQGLYAYTRPADGVRLTGQQRFHEGRVTAIEKDEATGMTWYAGEHVHGEYDGMWTSWKGYEPTFRCELAQLRVHGNLMAALVMPTLPDMPVAAPNVTESAAGGTVRTDGAENESAGEAAYES